MPRGTRPKDGQIYGREVARGMPMPPTPAWEVRPTNELLEYAGYVSIDVSDTRAARFPSALSQRALRPLAVRWQAGGGQPVG